MLTKLAYSDSTLNRGDSTLTYSVWYFTANGLYDPDPILGTGSVGGFLQYSALYRTYLVTHLGINWSVANNEGFPIIVGFGLATFDIASSLNSAAKCLNFLENGYTTGPKILSTSGGADRLSLSTKVNLGQFFGNEAQYHDSGEFSGLVSGNPASTLYLVFVSVADYGMDKGVTQGLDLQFTTKWYNRQDPFV
jgi:hypothetical protein